MTKSRLLIDSHVLIWLLYEPEKINPQAQNLVQSVDVVYLSIVSLWELTLKFNKHKLAYAPKDLMAGAQELNLVRLPLRDEHLLLMGSIKLPRKDLFDALLVAQSESENCIFITADNNILDSNYTTYDARHIGHY